MLVVICSYCTISFPLAVWVKHLNCHGSNEGGRGMQTTLHMKAVSKILIEYKIQQKKSSFLSKQYINY